MTVTHADIEAQWRPMVRTAKSVLGCLDEAEECAAAAVLQVLEQQPEVHNLQAFMVTVAKRRALDRVRVLERARRRDALLAAQTIDAADSADSVVDADEARWLQQEAVARLAPQAYRILRAVADGHGLEEIAMAEGISKRSAESHLRRARVTMRGVWARALGLLGAGWAAVKHLGPPAATAVAFAALTMAPLPFRTAPPPLESADPTFGGSSTSPAQHDRQTPVTPSSVDVPAPVRAAMLKPKIARPATRDVRPTPVVLIHEPAGQSTTVQDEHHGSGAEDGVAQGLVDCVRNTSVSLTYVGC